MQITLLLLIAITVWYIRDYKVETSEKSLVNRHSIRDNQNKR